MKFDVIVIGAGPGGYVCAIRLAQLGKKVALIEKHKLGGECLNYGCIPSKALIFASTLYDKISKKADPFGIEISGVHFNPSKLQSFRMGLISKLSQGIASLLKYNKVEHLAGEATFIEPHKISIGSQEIEADVFVISTGSQAAQIPGFEWDGQKVIGSKDALELSDIPKTLLVLGGGVIGLELGTYFSKLGSQVKVIEMMDQLLPGIDKELVSVVERELKKRGVEIYTSAKAKSLSKEGGVRLAVETSAGEKVLEGDKLLVTIGRKANTSGLGLEKMGVKLTDKGFIAVDSNLKTSVSNIYAIGDVVGPPLLAHKASHDGICVAEHISRGEKIIHRPLPWAIFTDPEIAGVGLTEGQAKAQGKEAMIGKFPFLALGRALAVAESEGFTKIVADKKTQEILGIFIVGAHASDLISEGALAVTHKLKLHDVASTIHPHPTLPEGIMEACEAALGKAIHIPNRP